MSFARAMWTGLLISLLPSRGAGQLGQAVPSSFSDLIGGKWSQWPGAKTGGGSTLPDSAAVEKERLDARLANTKADAAAADAAKKYGDMGLGWLAKAMKAGTDAVALGDAWAALTAQDRELDPNYSPPGMPQVPARCAGAPECAACFSAANDELNAIRIRFEKLRRVNSATQAFIRASLSFGDDVSAIHGIAGLAWQAERKKIEQSVKGYEAAYDHKYEELIRAIEQVMRGIGRCEAQYFDDPDWYGRYGFMYVTFMAGLYRR